MARTIKKEPEEVMSKDEEWLVIIIFPVSLLATMQYSISAFFTFIAIFTYRGLKWLTKKTLGKKQ